MIEMNRAKYFFACFAVYLTGIACSYLVLYVLPVNYDISDYRVAKVIIRTLVFICFMYFSIKRLQYIKWPWWLSLIFVISFILDADLWMLFFGMNFVESNEIIFDTSAALSLVLFVLLALKKNRNNET